MYEKPDSPELVLKTVHLSVEESTMQVVQMLEENVSYYLLVLLPMLYHIITYIYYIILLFIMYSVIKF